MSKLKLLKSKTSRTLVLLVVLFSSVVTLILTAIQLHIDYKDGINVIHQRITQIKLTNIESITQALWTLDNFSIKIQLDGLSRINDIIFVKIVDQNKKLIANSGEINTKNTISEEIDIYKNYRDKQTLLGTLSVVATKENVYQKLIDTVITILISQAIKTFLVSLFILFLFYYLVTRHLQKIASYSENLDLSTDAQALVLDRKKPDVYQNDDLDRVVKSINNMSTTAYNSYTRLLKNQSELSNREAQFKAIFNSISDAIVFANTERKIIQTNPAFYSQFGYSMDELEGNTTLMLYANPEEYQVQGKKRYSKEATPKSSIYEIEYKRKDGSTFPSETMGHAVKLSDGTPIGFIGIIRDITERKNAEKERIVLQNQLLQSQKMDAIGQLTGGIAHDFNNILASILGFAELTMMSLEKSDEHNLIPYIKNINTAGERARTLVAQMLSFSRSTSGSPENIELPLFIKEVTSLIRPTTPTSIDIKTNISKDIPLVYIDKTQLHQVLMNLCINARDAIENNGTITIDLSYEVDSKTQCNSCNKSIQGEYVKISVSDTGSGIPADILDKIFDPFMSTKEVGKGTGMGLSVVHGILHKHNAHITIETKLNAGTTLNLYLPPSHNITDAMPDEKSNHISKQDGKGKHILVVDDEKSITVLLKDILENYGYKVTCETDSSKAFDIFMSTDFDLVITDQTMPETSGIDLVKQILKTKPSTPIFLCSGYSESINEEEALKLGCRKYLDKPINFQSLLKALHDLFKNESA